MAKQASAKEQRDLSMLLGDSSQAVDGSKNELSTHDFVGRMKILADIAGSVNALAKKAGISQGGIRRYFEGGEPTLKILIALSNAAGVNMLWLATGIGPMRPTDVDGRAPPGNAGSLDAGKLKVVLVAVKEAITAGGYELTPAQEAEIITGVYEFCAAGPPGMVIPRSAVDHLLRAVSAGTKK